VCCYTNLTHFFTETTSIRILRSFVSALHRHCAILWTPATAFSPLPTKIFPYPLKRFYFIFCVRQRAPSSFWCCSFYFSNVMRGLHRWSREANAALLALDPNYNVVVRSNGLDQLLGCGAGRVETHLNTGPFFDFWGKMYDKQECGTKPCFTC
jgi:hypothetical protein